MNYDEVCFFSFPKLFLICSFLYRWMMISVKLSHLAGWFGCKFQAPSCWSNCLIKKSFHSLNVFGVERSLSCWQVAVALLLLSPVCLSWCHLWTPVWCTCELALMRFHTFAVAAITLSLCNADFMLGIRPVTDAAPRFPAPFFFFKPWWSPSMWCCYLFTVC